MRLSSLLIAHCVFEEGGIRAAARRLGLPPQTVSAAIARLEHHLALQLTDRHTRGHTVPLASLHLRRPFASAHALIMRMLHHHGAEAEKQAARLAVTIRALERILAVAQQGSIRRVSIGLDVPQPQLTRQISLSEKQLGQALFIRHAHGVRLTAYGEEFLAAALDLIALWEGMKGASDGRFSRVSRTIRVGAIIQTSPESWIANALSALVVNWVQGAPRKPIAVSAMPADALREALTNKRIDVALIDTVEGLESFAAITALQTDLVAIAPPGTKARTLKQVIATHPLCLTSGRTGLGQALLPMGSEFGKDIALKPMVEVESLPVLVSLVSDHGYMSLIGRVSAEALGRRVTIFELGRHIPFAFYIVWRDTPDAKAVALQLLQLLPVFAKRSSP